MLLYQNFLLDKTLSTFAEGKSHKLTGQQLKLLIAVSLLSKEMPVTTKCLFHTLREMQHSANYWWLRASLALLVADGLLFGTAFGKAGFKRYSLSICGKLLLHNLDNHFAKEMATFKTKYQI